MVKVPGVTVPPGVSATRLVTVAALVMVPLPVSVEMRALPGVASPAGSRSKTPPLLKLTVVVPLLVTKLPARFSLPPELKLTVPLPAATSRLPATFTVALVLRFRVALGVLVPALRLMTRLLLTVSVAFPLTLTVPVALKLPEVVTGPGQ